MSTTVNMSLGLLFVALAIVAVILQAWLWGPRFWDDISRSRRAGQARRGRRRRLDEDLEEDGRRGEREGNGSRGAHDRQVLHCHPRQGCGRSAKAP